MRDKLLNVPLVLFMVLLFFTSCNSGNTQHENKTTADSTVAITNSAIADNNNTAVDTSVKNTLATVQPAADLPKKVLVYYFHVKIRCVSCIAMEEATKKTLNTYFKEELNNGTIKLFVLNMDDKANSKIAEKYQAYGSGLYITRIFKGKETTSDLTTEGFKYAGEKEDKLIALLKAKVSEYLK